MKREVSSKLDVSAIIIFFIDGLFDINYNQMKNISILIKIGAI